MSAVIQFRGQNHSVEVAVNPHLRHPLILGTNWPTFSELLRCLCVDVAWGKKKQGRGAFVQMGEADQGPLSSEPREQSEIERLILSRIKAWRVCNVHYANYTNCWALNRFAPASITHKRTDWWNDLIAH